MSTEPAPLLDRVLRYLRQKSGEARQEAVRDAVPAKMQNVVDALRHLEKSGVIVRTALDWQVVNRQKTQNKEPGETEAGSAEEQPAEG